MFFFPLYNGGFVYLDQKLRAKLTPMSEQAEIWWRGKVPWVRLHVFPCLPRTGHVIATTCTTKGSMTWTSAKLALSAPLKLMMCKQTTNYREYIELHLGRNRGVERKAGRAGAGVKGNVDDQSAIGRELLSSHSLSLIFDMYLHCICIYKYSTSVYSFMYS